MRQLVSREPFYLMAPSLRKKCEDMAQATRYCRYDEGCVATERDGAGAAEASREIRLY